jgi:hypothetical protein
MIRLAFGVFGCCVVVAAAVAAAGTAAAVPFALVVGLVGCVIVAAVDRGPIR